MTTLREAALLALDTLKWHLKQEAYGADIEGVTARLEAALAEPQTTHSTDCYKWHHQCAIAEVQRLRAALAEQALDRMAEHARETGLDYEPVPLGLVAGNPFTSRCPNCASLEEQNTELDRKLADRKPLTEDEIDRITRDRWGTQLLGVMVQAHREYARAIEAAHGIIETKIKGDKDA